MEDNFNTAAGWALFSGIVALGLSSLSSRYFEADKNHPPHHVGYEVAGAAAAEGGEAAVPLEVLLAKGDAAKGEAQFKKCMSCHTINQGGANGIGPNLYGIVGEPVASGRGGFAFSDDLKKAGGKWDFAALDHWIANPKGMAAGTKMTFAGLDDAQARADLIVYLNNQGSNLPLPAAPAETAAAPADGKAAADAGAAPAAGAAAAAPAEAPKH